MGGEGASGKAGSSGFPTAWVRRAEPPGPARLWCHSQALGRKLPVASAAHSGAALSAEYGGRGLGIPRSGRSGSPEPVSAIPTGPRGTASGASAEAWRAGGGAVALAPGPSRPAGPASFPSPPAPHASCSRKARRRPSNQAPRCSAGSPQIARSGAGGAAGAQRTTLRGRLCLRAVRPGTSALEGGRRARSAR